MRDRNVVGACCFLSGLFVILATGSPYAGAAVFFGLAAIATAILSLKEKKE